jgi:hypothetical protein
MTDRRPPGWLRPTAAEPTSERAVLDVRGSRSEATAAGLASATVVGRSTVGIALAKPNEVGMIRRGTGWRGVRAGWPDRSSVAAKQADAEPADRRTAHPSPSGCGPAGSTATCSTLCGASLPQRDSSQLPSCVADRSQAQKSHPTATGTERSFNRRS